MRRVLTQQERQSQSDWRSQRRAWTLELATLLRRIPDSLKALQQAQRAILATPHSTNPIPPLSDRGILVSTLASSRPAGGALVGALAAVAAAQGEAMLQLAVLAETLRRLRVLATWQLSEEDAAELHLRLVPEVR